MAYTKVAVSGATGNLGPAVVEQLVQAGFEVTVLSSRGETRGLPRGVTVQTVDYSCRDSVVSALRGCEAFVSLVPDHGGGQTALVDAAMAAGVQRFVPSEFGSDVAGNGATAALPVFAGKKKTQDYLAARTHAISHTIVVTGLFLDWGLRAGLLADLRAGGGGGGGGPATTTVYDGGDAERSTTTRADVGRAVVGVLRHPAETENRAVYVQTAAVSQNQILAMAETLQPGVRRPRRHASTANLERESYELLRRGDGDDDAVGRAMLGFITVAVFNTAYGSNWSERTDNALLGVRHATREEVQEIVRQNM